MQGYSDVGVGPVNIGNPAEVTVRQQAQEIIDLTGSSSQIVDAPRPVDDPQVRFDPTCTPGPIIRVLGDPSMLDRLRACCTEDASRYGVAMTTRFTAGARNALATPRV